MTSKNNDELALKSILLSSPPGEFDQVLSNLRSILPKSPLLEQSQLQNSNSFLSSLQSEWESSTGRSVLSANTGADDKDIDKKIKSLRKAMDGYISLKFSSDGVKAACRIDNNPSSSAINITTYAERIDLHNHNAGSWMGKFTVEGETLSGTVTIRVHTFENGGNFHLHSNVTLGPIVIKSGDSADRWASLIMQQIQSWEDHDIVEKMHEMYDSIGSVHLKSLRRVMPITRTKMEWNVMAHRVVSTLGEGHGKEKFKH